MVHTKENRNIDYCRHYRMYIRHASNTGSRECQPNCCYYRSTCCCVRIHCWHGITTVYDIQKIGQNQLLDEKMKRRIKLFEEFESTEELNKGLDGVYAKK